jgi:proteic killer suppression protein
MIKSFRNKIAQHLFDGINSKESRKLHSELHPKAVRLLDQLNAITDVETLRVPPSNNLEKLLGQYKGYWSIRINLKWRVIFRWEEENAYDVDIVDYHP